MSPRFLLMPPFPADETINSLLERVAGYNYGGTLRAECVRLLNRNRPLLDTIPCSIGRFCQLFCNAYGDPSRVVHEHTLYDFYACGVTAELLSAFRNRIINDSRGPLRPSRLPLFFNCSEQECLQCIDCDEQNLRRHGFVFTYRQHATPFVEVCPWHGTALKAKKGMPKYYGNRCRGSEFGNPKDIAEYSLRTANAICLSWEESYYRRDLLTRQLTEARWISEEGRCAMTALLLTFHKRFDKAFGDERLRLLCSEPQYAAAALRAVLRPDRNVHPVWCVLFKWLADVAENTNVTRQRSVRAGQPKVRVDAEHELSVLSSAPSMRQASVTLGVSINTSLRLARKFGISFKGRPKTISEPDKQRIIELLKTGRLAAEVAAEFKVSLSTVYRLLPSASESRVSARELQLKERLGAARENWLATLQKHPDSTVTHLRRKVTADWAYLYRHDRTWLRAHSPHRQTAERRHSRKPHAVLLAAAVGAVADASEKCGHAESTPIRRSAYRLQTMSGLSDYQFNKLMSSKGIRQLGVAAETHSSFVARRMQWVAAIDHDAVHATVWRVARRAGLRPCSVASLINNQESFEVPAGD